MDLFTISSQTLATGQGNLLLLFVGSSGGTVWQVRYELLGKKREWEDTPPLDRLSTCDWRGTEEVKALRI